MKARRFLVSLLIAVVAAGAFLTFDALFSGLHAEPMIADSVKPLPGILSLLLDDPDLYTIIISPNTILFTEPGQASQLTATAYNKQGNVAYPNLTWSSSNPQVVSVNKNGFITSSASVGSATITALSGNSVSNSVMVIVANPAEGAVVVSDDQVVGEIVLQDPDAPWDLGTRINVRLSGIAPPDSGTILIGTGEKPFGGRVVSAVHDGNEVEVVLENVITEDMFTDLVISEEVDLSRQVPIIAKVFADNYDVSWQPGGKLEFMLRKTAQLSALPSSTLMSSTSSPMGTQVLNSNSNLGPFECESNFPLPLVLDGFPTDITVTNNLWVDFDYDSDAGGFQRALLRGDVTGTIKVSNTLSAALQAKVTCETTLALIPIPVSPYLALYVPLGLGFELDGKLTLAQLGFELKTEAKADVLAGVQCPGGSQCTMVGNLDTNAKANINWITPPDLSGSLEVLAALRLEPALSGFFFSGLDIGAPPPIPVRAKVAKFQAGLKQAGNFAIVEGQMVDENYSSNYLLSLDSSLGPGETVGAAMNILRINIATVQLTWTTPLAQSPKAFSAIADVKDFEAGDLVTFTVNLDPQHISYPIIGYNVAKVSIYRRTEDDIGGIGPAKLLAEVIPASGVTEVQMTWTADVDGSIEGDYFAFVETNALPFPYFGELEVATITPVPQPDLCDYYFNDAGFQGYTKICPNGERYDHGQEYIIGGGATVHTSDMISKAATINNIPVFTAWRKMFDTRFIYCYPSIPSGWFVIGNVDYNGDYESINATGQTLFPTSYTFNGDITVCYPDYQWYPYKDCGVYFCPAGVFNIQPTLDFPGDCHAWWDHFDSQGVWQECTY